MVAARMVSAALVALVLSLAALTADTASAAGPIAQRRSEAGLFSNYYVTPNIGIGSKMYPSPRPVPAWVGHTYYTYEGLYPHQHLYPHYDVYHRYQGLHKTNTTRILYW